MQTFLVFLCYILLTTSYPYNGYRSFPQRTVMFGGYYGHPLDTRNYPQGSMTFAAGDTIATNSFLGEDPVQPDLEIEETTRKSAQEFPRIDEGSIAEEELSTQRTPKRKPQKPVEKDDEETVDSSWPFQGGRNGPSYNAFFPIMFGGSGSRAKSGEGSDQGYYPGPATAIANSFSTGKGGVATSHATSFGDPNFATLLRNFNSRKAKSGERDE